MYEHRRNKRLRRGRAARFGTVTQDGALKNAAILLFDKHVRQFFRAATFKIGRFHNDERDLIV